MPVGGSSPRTWGLRPAAYISFHIAPVHPHARGAYTRIGAPTQPFSGSSPRTWGLRTDRAWIASIVRFIPTHVGLTFVWGPEYGFDFGSSPRTWGLQNAFSFFRQSIRFIPTHVGLTPIRRAPRRYNAVHPHARGAYDFLRVDRHADYGSSPRTWGLRARPAAAHVVGRFIPTHVGLTGASRSTFSASAVHPHARGAYCTLAEHLRDVFGSSPRTWGLQCFFPEW